MPHPAPPRRRRRTFRLISALAIALAVATTSSCASSSDTQAPTADDTATTKPPAKRTTTTSTATTDDETERGQIEKSYQDAFLALALASAAPSSPHDTLNQHFEGESLAFVNDELSRLAAEGIRVTYPEDTPPVPSVSDVKVTSPSDAVVSVCLIDNGVQIAAGTGEVLDDQVVSKGTFATMHLVDGRWRLASAQSTGDWNDGNGCDR